MILKSMLRSLIVEIRNIFIYPKLAKHEVISYETYWQKRNPNSRNVGLNPNLVNT